MKKIFALMCALHIAVCAVAQENCCREIKVVPRPQKVEMKEGSYTLNGCIDKAVKYLQDKTLGEEAYKLEVTEQGITVWSSTDAGKFYARQTLRQMVPPCGGHAHQGKSKCEERKVQIPCCVIEDAPVFAYRGAHFDVCRHFFSIDDVKTYIDILAMHKLNRFHWHLTDDQGWRIEIKAYPKLTEIGAWRDSTVVRKDWRTFDRTRHGGFYTQKEAKEIVKYAADRHITVIPEIDLPGHALAALSAYPEFGCRGDKYVISSTWGVFPEVFCPGKEKTFKFWEAVLSEIIDIFPSEYIHIGGDECPREEWKKCADCQARIKQEGLRNEAELQSYVTRRLEQFLNEKGRKIIGWDEILEGGVTPTATIMSWTGTRAGIAAAKKGNHVIMSPSGYCYLDHYQTQGPDEPFGIGGFTSLEKSYSFDPWNELTQDEQKYILGVQGNLWTEYIGTLSHAQHNLLPRISALAEVGWTYYGRDYKNFLCRMNHLRHYFDAYGWNYAKYEFQNNKPCKKGAKCGDKKKCDKKKWRQEKV